MNRRCTGTSEARTMGDEAEPPPESTLTRSKKRWAQACRLHTAKPSRAVERPLPPGQHLTKDWPTLDLGLTPEISHARWHLDVYGAVQHPVFWGFAEFSARAQTKVRSDIHCVTSWSRYDNQWIGLPTRELLAGCKPREEARFVVLHSY